MKKVENSLAITGFISKDAEIKVFNTASVARFSIAISKGEKKEEETVYTSAFLNNIEAWSKNENTENFNVLKKGQIITIEGYFKPEQWQDKETGKQKNKIILVATRFYPALEKEEDAAATEAQK